MKVLSSKVCGFVLVSVVVLFSVGISGADQKVPISFNDYHGYTDVSEYLRDVSRAYPDITELLEIGKSTMGRSIHVLVISNMKTGTTIDAQVELRNLRKEGVKNVIPMKPYQGKPGHWISAATHGNEYTGTEVTLYIIDKLVSGYGSDSEITHLVDEKTFYICPAINVDGFYSSIEGGIPQRQNSALKDDDGDGKVNEDGPEDLNGDGHITQFRYQDPEGQYVIDDVDPRLMIRLGDDETTTKPRYSLITEDKDNDGDGEVGEDSERGIDLNRNYPEGWFTDDGMPGGSGDYATSAPESHAVVEFFTNHRNILMAQFFHTAGGFTLRPMASVPHSGLHPKDVAVLDMIMGKKYLEIIDYEIPEAWQNPEKLDELRAGLRKTSTNKYAIERGYEMPQGWRFVYNEATDVRHAHGLATDWAYRQQGTYSLTIELWNPQKDIEGFPQFEGEDSRVQVQRELLKYQDANHGGKWFIPWTSYRHPEHGEGEIGGWIPRYRSNNALPEAPLVGVCENHWQFELFRAGLLPEIVITDARAEVLATSANAREGAVSQEGDQVTINRGSSKEKYNIVEVTATIENKGSLATHIADGEKLAGNREDVVWLVGDRNKVTFLQGTPFMSLGVLEGAMEIPGYEPRAAAPPPPPRQPPSRGAPSPEFPRTLEQRQRSDQTQERQTGSTREVRWLVAVEGDSPLTIVVSSQKGGTRAVDLKIN